MNEDYVDIGIITVITLATYLVTKALI